MTMKNNPIITTTWIPDGNAGTRATLVTMANLATCALSDELFSTFATMFNTTNDVDRQLRPRYQYLDEEVETLYAPEYNLLHMLETGYLIGDCDDIAMFYAAIFKGMGLPTRLVAMRTKHNDPEFYHVVVEVFERNRWRRYDPTVVPSLAQVDFGQMVQYV